MTFNHVGNYTWPQVKRKNIDGVRHYVDGDDNIYSSVTKVVGSLADEGIKAWREKVGDAVADHIMIKAQVNGTRLHTLCEDYLNNKRRLEYKDILSKGHFENIKPMLKNIDNIRGQEVQMFSPKMGLAGTVDCVADYKGVLSVIDFKTSSKKKPEAWVEQYFLQTTCYALMWEEQTGEAIDHIVIIMTGEDLSQTVFVKNKADYVERLHEVIYEFQLADAQR